ncbi:raffinose/stachyose/melibiose transport system substrate-binding protein [Streptoalloteichus tenebrarius]|uniref:Raffinose/stachyose/melibiose transport system substrate-binding protein n=1 Tax=Streptoalloteichus tenebrarius (strain ATCC 17920 / DSM 40477 / JCM 4838 / CBS 697.72 / NBRC 16177 / NCIMB 11028 / NRRL B-12390 / A12253. 1 / ISP 5477) TaxID=1933 RepID=A0ABT1I3L4_STRSD|nr:extracellular solute-binding protein [Streptoalloteichus tenebrarius]MCP2262330.1 raffinose/stachyose/melibiose transport system substrate-binding protein [Streptoalloteichus tenebrarius]BFF02224.1 hypothetical protein GCM10020241_38990 [Streptoalloteichus tenebrarius]
MVRYGRRGTALLSVLLSGALALSPTSCGSDADAGDGRSLTYWSMWKENEPQARVLREAALSFEREHGVRVVIQWQGRDVMKKVAPALRGGVLPDLVDQDQSLVRATLVATGTYRDLSGLYGADVDGRRVSDVVSPRYGDLVREDGKPYLVPYEVIGYGLWFDGAALPEVAERPPNTWDEFIALLARRRATGAAPLALDGDISQYNALWTIGALQGALGRDRVNELARDPAGVAWRRPEVRAVLDAVAGLVRDGFFAPGHNGSRWPAVQERWSRGEADFLLMGSWAPAETGPKARPGFRYRFAALPSAGAQRYVPVEAIGFAIPRRARNPEAAERFVAHFLRDEHLGRISSVARNLTPNPALPVPDELADLAEATRTLPVARVQDGLAQDFPGYVEEVFWPANDQLLRGVTDVDGFLERLAARQANYWKKNR